MSSFCTIYLTDKGAKATQWQKPFQQMVVEQLDIYMPKKISLDTDLHIAQKLDQNESQT